MSASISKYLALISSEHADKPNFTAMVSLLVQPCADNAAAIDDFSSLFDIDSAVGDQLDKIGEWVGRSRQIPVDITGVYFSFDTAGVGWDEGLWFGPGDSSTGLSNLDDVTYRLVLKGQIAINQWDGSVPGAVDAWAALMQAFGYYMYIKDNQDMTMDAYLSTIKPTVNAAVQGLFDNDLLGIRPAGVQSTASILKGGSSFTAGYAVAGAAIAGMPYTGAP